MFVSWLAQGVGEDDDTGLWDAALCRDEVRPDPADIGGVDNDTSLWRYEVGPDLAAVKGIDDDDAVLWGDEVVPDLAAVDRAQNGTDPIFYWTRS